MKPYSRLLPTLVLVAAGLLGPTMRAADPVVSDIVTTVRGGVDITFTLADADGDHCWIFPFAHNPTTREHIPMTCFLEVNGPAWLNELATRRFPPGRHTITWLPGGDWGERDFGNIVVHVRADDAGRCAPGRFLVIDLSAGHTAPSYPYEIKHFVDVRQPVYKTEKLVLRELPNGAWAGVYEVTQRQYQLVTNATPSSFDGNPMRPVEQVSWNTIRGGAWPGQPADSTFVKHLRNRTGIAELDLPEESLWEYACRAGATRNYSDYSQERGKGSDSTSSLNILGWYSSNSGSRTHNVGEQQANAWALFDMHGNVWEWTLTASGSDRVKRGGCWYYSAGSCAAGNRYGNDPGLAWSNGGFRLFLPAGWPGGAGGGR